MDLSPLGLRQAAALAEYLHGRKFDAVYASPMKRVQQTLAPLLLNGTPRPVIVPELREVDFGDWTGLRWEEVQPRFGVSAFDWLEQLECAGIANAECDESLRARLGPCLRQILSRHAGQQVAVFCHGGVIRVLLAILFDWPISRFRAFEIDYASVTRVELVATRPRLQLLNLTPWREKAP